MGTIEERMKPLLFFFLPVPAPSWILPSLLICRPSFDFAARHWPLLAPPSMCCRLPPPASFSHFSLGLSDGSTVGEFDGQASSSYPTQKQLPPVPPHPVPKWYRQPLAAGCLHVRRRRPVSRLPWPRRLAVDGLAYLLAWLLLAPERRQGLLAWLADGCFLSPLVARSPPLLACLQGWHAQPRVLPESIAAGRHSGLPTAAGDMWENGHMCWLLRGSRRAEDGSRWGLAHLAGCSTPRTTPRQLRGCSMYVSLDLPPYGWVSLIPPVSRGRQVSKCGKRGAFPPDQLPQRAV